MKSIYGRAFITLVSSFLFIAIVYKLFTGGDYTLNIQKVLVVVKNNFEKWDFYKKIVVMFVGDTKYNVMTTFEKNFFFSNNTLTLSSMLEPLGEIWLIGDFIKGFMNMLISSLAMIFILLDIVLHLVSYLMTLAMILFDLLSNLGGIRSLILFD